MVSGKSARSYAKSNRSRLLEYLQHYDPRLNDPELMGRHPDFNTHAQFHHDYFRHVFRQKGLTYTKRNPGHVLDLAFLDELLKRVLDEPEQLVSLQGFLNFCEQVGSEITAT